MRSAGHDRVSILRENSGLSQTALPHFGRIGIVGLGQIGTSLALGLRNTREVVGYDIATNAREEFLRSGFRVASSLDDLLLEVELCFFAVPAGSFKSMLAGVFAALADSKAVIADLCSTKLDIEEAVLAGGILSSEIRYVGLHPLAGNERRGSLGADAELFRGRTMVVSSGVASHSLTAMALAQLLISTVGCRAMFVNPAVHDRVTNFTIQLPHIFAYLTSSFAQTVPDQTLLTLLSGNSFADVTRVANSSPEMVASFLYANREILKASLRQLDGKLAAMVSALGEADETTLAQLLGQYAPRGSQVALEAFADSHRLAEVADYRRVILDLESRRALVDSIRVADAKLEIAGERATEPDPRTRTGRRP